MTDQEQVRRAEQAKAILDSPVWIEAWESAEKYAIDVWKKAPMDAASAMMNAKAFYMGAIAARAHIELVIRNGKVSAATIAADELRNKYK